ncbi:MAG TPA: ABC transporter ATP-binding protein [Blastocatellia bacterium]|nr:ABC transporter ATP-binding protein [Blastocatellia bacterium]
MSEYAIRVEQISKRYRIGKPKVRYRTLRETLSETASRWRTFLRRSADGQSDDSIWALKDISLEVKPGEVLGLIGRNGAGKSTLLKILSRITEPTSGHAEIHGRVGSLLEVGTGFHYELTGRENIYLNGAILGMKRAEIDRKFDEIAAFAEIEKFIETPVKRYSSGMYLRLAFAVAAHLETEILLVDEVLAVGDAAFQRKCLGKMQEAGASGRTVIFVSHDLTAISRLADVSVYLERGEVRFIGPTEEAIRLYASQPLSNDGNLGQRKDRLGDGIIRLESLAIYDAEGRRIESIGSGEPVTISIGYRSDLKNLEPADVAIDMRFTDLMGHPVTTFSTRFTGLNGQSSLPQSGILTCRIPGLALAEEQYSIDLWVGYRSATADFIQRAGDLTVTTADYYGTGYAPVKRKHGAALFKHEWKID